MRGADLKTRSGVIVDNNEKFDVFWGCAQWALTGHCAQYILEFYDSHPTFNRWFYYAFPADELYIHTIVFNSPYASQTTHGGPEPEAKPLERWRNLHYFESATNESGTVFGEHDYDRLRVRPELYVRKVTTEASSKLLDRLDADTKVTLTLPPNEVGTHTPGRHMQCPAENTTSMAVDFSAARTKVAPYITYEVVDVRGVTTRVHAAAVTHGGQEPRVSRSPLCGVTKALRVTRRRRGEDLNTVTCCRCRRRLQKAGVL